MILQNGRVLSEDGSHFEQRTLYIDGECIAVHADGEVFDAAGLYVLPGMIDTHIHGYGGEEFAKPDGDFGDVPRILAADGVTGFAATVRCMPFDDMCACAANAAAQIGKKTGGTKVLAVHSEGPFVSSVRKGAMHPPELTCTVEAVQALQQAAGGALKLMTMAPERENALEVIAECGKLGLTVTMGHTDATYAQATAAIDAGAVRATHIFNAMRPLSHRETGILGAVLTDERVRCEMIADFVHLDPAAVKLVYLAKGADRISLISDAGAMSGLPNGDYVVGGRVRTVKDGLCLDAQGHIAGSCYSMLKGAQNLRSLGIPLEEIAVMASYNPAKDLGVFDTVGSLAVGKKADVIVVDNAMNVHAVFVDGGRIV